MKRLVIAALLLITTQAFATTPTVSNVTGTLTTGQTLTITGTHMVDQASGTFTESAGSFEGASYSADGWTLVNGDGAYDTDTHLLGSNSFRSDITGSVTGGCPTNNVMGDSIYRAMNRYNRMYVRYSSNFGTRWAQGGYTKMVETVSPGQQYIQPNPASGGPTTMYVSGTGGNDADFSLPSTWVVDRWYCIEWYIGDSTMTVWVDGTEIGTISGAETYHPYPQLGIINNCPCNGTFAMYMDGVMANSSRVYPSSTIEISGDNGSTWTYQPPTGLSDTSITITASLPTLTASSYLMRVTNNLQETSTTYTLGASSSGSLRPGVSAAGVTFR